MCVDLVTALSCDIRNAMLLPSQSKGRDATPIIVSAINATHLIDIFLEINYDYILRCFPNAREAF